jgi:uncharacterized protein (TIGR02246 family)
MTPHSGIKCENNRVTDLEAVRALNESFYAALEGLDLEGMTRVWQHGDGVQCIHPGGDLLQGWPTIRTSWERIFAGGGWMRVTPTRADIRLDGDLGVVVCYENITRKVEADVRVSLAVATNIYRKTAEGWRMIHHHASPAPVNVTQPFSGTVQ